MRRDPLAIALGVAAGFLAGVLLVLGLGALDDDTIPPPATVTVEAPVRTVPGGTIVRKTEVPELVGERLDIAQERVRRAGFVVDVDGGGVLGVVRERNWEVVAQDPAPGGLLEQGSTVRLRIERR